MIFDCRRIAESASVRLAAMEVPGKIQVEAEFTNGYSSPLWVPQEPVPSYRVDPQTHAVVLSYGYFEDVYGPYRGRYMLPPMKGVQPGEAFRWRIEDAALLNKLLAPYVVSALRMRVAVRDFPSSNVRGAQPLDEYLESSCPVQSKTTVLRP